MNKILLFLVLCLLSVAAKAQTPNEAVTTTQPYGHVDMADLKLTSCDFEKGANAMVLFDKTDVNTGFTSTTVLRHKRIKILTDIGTDQANVTISYTSKHSIETVSDIEAETINLDDGKVVITKVDKSQIFKQTSDKSSKKITFTFPRVKAGSIIEYSYKLSLGFEGAFPDWAIQQDIPVRYSELNAAIRKDYSYKTLQNLPGGYSKNLNTPWINSSGDTIGIKYEWGFKNINSYREEPFAASRTDNQKRIRFILSAIKFTLHGNLRPLGTTWYQLGAEIAYYSEFKQALNDSLKDDDKILAEANLLHTDIEKIAYVFNHIKKSIKWNGDDVWYINDGAKAAWEKKSGNSTEINLILYYFLKEARIRCFPLFVSTRDNGKINPGYPDMNAFNKMVLSITASDKVYTLDASNKFNMWTDIPFSILNSKGFFIDPRSNSFLLVPLKNDNPSRKIVFVNAEIKAGGKLEGNAQINNFSYNRVNSLQDYDKLGEKEYTDKLKDNDNNLKITRYKRENVEKDTLPLTESFDFQLDLAGSDEDYIFINPNLFTSFHTNPFLSKTRNSDIDFGCLNYYAINGIYKIPAGYKVESVPKPTSLMVPDTSITFKRVVAEQEGSIMVHYTINYKQTFFPADEYPGIRAFYKKMFELLNEQIVLKKN